MSSLSWLDTPSLRTLEFPLTNEQLAPLDPRCKIVQCTKHSWSSLPTEKDWARLSDFLRGYPRVALRVFGHDGPVRDLDFLRHFPSLEHFACDVYQLDGFTGLGYLPKTLKSLHLGQTKKRSFSLKFLERFPNLEDLFIEGHTKDFEMIGSLANLRRLTIRSVSVPSLDSLKQLPRLWSLDIKLGGTRNLEALRQLPGLKYLELWMIRGLEHIEPVSDLVGLQYLFLEELARIQKLPSLARLDHLRRLHIQKLSRLRDLSPIREARALEELIVWYASHMQREDFEVLREHPSLKYASIGTGSVRRDAEIRQMLGLGEFIRMKDDFEFH